ncbi:EamA family transporter [Acinetobacter baumannii]|uniref:DMT family transporter n=1 Tax=Acinetobacter baumannii TaxID=470 RepID=UPI000819915A|nr:DMT family transporter [Acinetobacter baumannii]EIB7122019.1 DMT family transporter [Acinetobacter baumannii]MCT9283212.1 DMT family transporter [Acinetobacter baumannii]MDC4379498.1 DMT family transporter [Acinetobacter baumannii]OTK92162.1 EamA family transporter [Acinetobacter baumannii]SCD16565.1 Membrane protein putative [Acinetobacter baumannii]
MDDHYLKRKVGTLEMVIAMLLSGSIGLFVIKSGQSPVNIVFFRCLISALCLIPICYLYGHFRKVYFGKKELFLMVTSGLLIIFNWVLLFAAFPKTSISLATIVYHVNPFVILFLGALVFHEKLNKNDVLWTIVAFIGLIVIIGLGSASVNSNELVGLGLVLIATTLYSISVLITKKLSNTPPLLIVFIQTLSGAIVMAPFISVFENPPIGQQWLFVVGLGVLHTAFLYYLMYSAIKKIPLNNIAILSFIYPISTIVIDYFFFDHVLTSTQVLGAGLILLGVLGVKLHWNIFALKSA